VSQEVCRSECVYAYVAIDAAWHVDEVVEAACEAVGELEFGFGQQGEGAVEVLFV
jgi:hypothetical protein